MLHEAVSEPGDLDAAAVEARYYEHLASTVEELGVEQVVERSALDPELIRRLADGERPELTLADAAAVLAARPEAPGPEEAAALARDALLMGMTNAVMDVEAVAAAVDGDLDPKEIQSKVEGRYPMTVGEYALLAAAIDRNGP